MKTTTMEQIPNITFRKRLDTRLEFGIFTLQNLFQRQHKLHHRLDAPHRPDFFIILLITQGRGMHFVDFQLYAYQPGTIFFISPELFIRPAICMVSSLKTTAYLLWISKHIFFVNEENGHEI